MADAILKPIDKNDGAWRGLKLWLQTEVRKQQRQLEDVTGAYDERAANISRGRIAAYRDLIAAVEPDKTRLELAEAEQDDERYQGD